MFSISGKLIKGKKDMKMTVKDFGIEIGKDLVPEKKRAKSWDNIIHVEVNLNQLGIMDKIKN
jgi:hypothetical protein